MATITISSEKQTETGWQFTVEVSDSESARSYTVTVTQDDWQNLTAEQVPPAKLIKQSFRFLLTKESKESILSSFDLSVIKTYFPNYEQAMTTHFNSSSM